MKMALKRIKSSGKVDNYDYLVKAAKLTKYEVDISLKTIYVPEPELQYATDNDLAVAHLVNGFDFHIQSCIPEATYQKEVYNPDTIRRERKAKEATVEPKYKSGQLFKILSTSTIMRLERIIEGKKVELCYISHDERLGRRANLISSIEQLDKMLNSKLWVNFSQ